MMLFHSFKNQEQRRAFGGSEFLELQFCQLKSGTSLENIVNSEKFDFWRDNSLYVHGDDWNVFYTNYKNIFTDGVYNNLECGEIDWCGINYYSPEKVEDIIKAIEKNKPRDYKVVLEWLIKAKEFNGVYILGL